MLPFCGRIANVRSWCSGFETNWSCEKRFYFTAYAIRVYSPTTSIEEGRLLAIFEVDKIPNKFKKIIYFSWRNKCTPQGVSRFFLLAITKNNGPLKKISGTLDRGKSPSHFVDRVPVSWIKKYAVRLSFRSYLSEFKIKCHFFIEIIW